MKRVFKSIIAMAIVMMMLFNVAVFANEEKEITVVVNGTKIEFDVPPMTENYRTLVPMRYIFEALGATVEWNNDTNTATAVKGDITISITIDNNIMLKNGEPIELDVPARLVNDRTLVPVRAVSEGMGAEVNWVEETQTVIIETVDEKDDLEREIEEHFAANGQNIDFEYDRETGMVTMKPADMAEADSSEVLDFTTLSEKDMQLLKESVGEIRYAFEQYTLPATFFASAEVTTEFIKNKDQKAIDLVNKVWNAIVSEQIVAIQLNSETAYELDASVVETANAEEIMNVYKPLVEKAELDASNYFESSFVDLKNGNTMLLVEFKDADELVECKYLGIVITSDNAMRYFTAEADAFDTEHLFVCEIDDSDEARGKTHVLIEKSTDKDGFTKVIEEILAK